MSVLELLESLQTTIDAAKVDATKLVEKGNDSAGRRVRKAMQDVKKLAQQVREGVLELREDKE